MTNRHMTPTAVVRWIVTILVGLAARSALQAQDAPPPIPKPDSERAPAYPVVRVIDVRRVSVRIDGQERAVTLCGVTTPASEAACDQLLRFLENLLHGEDVFLIHDSATGADPPDSRPAHLFRAPDGLFVNLEIVRQGYAKVRSEPACKHLPLLRHYERRAQQVQKGVWAARPRPQRGAKSHAVASQPAQGAGKIIVYVTKLGEKYHCKSCYHLRKSSRRITLKEAVAKGYEPCAHCKPPTLNNP